MVILKLLGLRDVCFLFLYSLIHTLLSKQSYRKLADSLMYGHLGKRFDILVEVNLPCGINPALLLLLLFYSQVSPEIIKNFTTEYTELKYHCRNSIFPGNHKLS